MSNNAVEQAHKVTPPRRGQCIQLTVDSTARGYDLTGLSMAGYTPDAGGSRSNEVYLTLRPNGADVFFHFRSDSGADIDDTAAIAAGGTLAYANAHGDFVKDGESAEVLIERAKDKYLVVKTASGSAVLHLRASSDAR